MVYVKRKSGLTLTVRLNEFVPVGSCVNDGISIT